MRMFANIEYRSQVPSVCEKTVKSKYYLVEFILKNKSTKLQFTQTLNHLPVHDMVFEPMLMAS